MWALNLKSMDSDAKDFVTYLFDAVGLLVMGSKQLYLAPQDYFVSSNFAACQNPYSKSFNILDIPGVPKKRNMFDIL